MSIEELEKNLQELDLVNQLEKNKLMRAFAMAKAEFSVGDTVTDGGNTIIIERIKWGKNEGHGFGKFNPHPIYNGVLLTKKLEPRKDEQTMSLYGYDDITKIK